MNSMPFAVCSIKRNEKALNALSLVVAPSNVLLAFRVNPESAEEIMTETGQDAQTADEETFAGTVEDGE